MSYKGGAPGFVRVVDPTHLMFPSYDGNGMYLSMGNITANPHVGFLFIDFERPFRLRVQGEAEVSAAPEHLACFKEAELVVRVKITELWMNCPRYIHRYQKLEDLALRAAGRHRDAAVRVEAHRAGAGRAAPARAGASGEGRHHPHRGVDRPRRHRRRERLTRAAQDTTRRRSGLRRRARFFAKRLLARYGGVGLPP